jgi:myotubularin-related protein 1/2
MQNTHETQINTNDHRPRTVDVDSNLTVLINKIESAPTITQQNHNLAVDTYAPVNFHKSTSESPVIDASPSIRAPGSEANGIHLVKSASESLVDPTNNQVDSLMKGDTTSSKHEEGVNVAVSKCYKETLEIALLTLNMQTQLVAPERKLSQEEIPNIVNHNIIKKYSNNRHNLEGISYYLGETNESANAIRFIPGEKPFIEWMTEILIYHNNERVIAKTVMTGYRLMFQATDNYIERNGLKKDFFSIPHTMIAKIEKHDDKKSHTHGAIDITVKDGRKFRIVFPGEDGSHHNTTANRHPHEFIEKYYGDMSIARTYAYMIYMKFSVLELKYKGWSLYNFDKEYQRQGVKLKDINDHSPKNAEDIAYFKKVKNEHGNLPICSSYPGEFIVPALISMEELIRCAKFRSKERLPVLSYYYKQDEKKPAVTLWRSSQTNTGITSNRSEEDELMLRLMGEPKTKDYRKGEVNLHVYDARSYIAAMGNKVKGHGFEDKTYYKNVEINFNDIDNIHAVREHYQKLVELCESHSKTGKWLTGIDQTGWYDMVSGILVSARKIVEDSLRKGVHALVHCSDGWDRTAQLISVTQILLDPYFRTIEGFEVLVEKEWISFGHMFRIRCKHFMKDPTKKDEKDEPSPVFLQFLDCVHQLVTQFPMEFEFNTKFLEEIAYHTYTCLFGTFLCINEKEMTEHKVKTQTISLWSYLNYRKEIYRQHIRDNIVDIMSKKVKERREILPETSASKMRFWIEHFGYYWMKALPSMEYYQLNYEFNSYSDVMSMAYDIERVKNSKLAEENAALLKKLQNYEGILVKLQQAKDFELIEEEANNSQIIPTISTPPLPN